MDWDEGPTVAEVAEMMKMNCGSGECDIYLTEQDGEQVLACYHCDRTADPLG